MIFISSHKIKHILPNVLMRSLAYLENHKHQIFDLPGILSIKDFMLFFLHL